MIGVAARGHRLIGRARGCYEATMVEPRAPGRAWLATLLLLGACAKPAFNPPFYDNTYRQQYAISAEELKTLQFFISQEVVAHAIDGSPGVAPDQVVIVAARTPGLVRDVGPDWLRVAFTKEGEGALFRTRAGTADSVYALATTTESGTIALVGKLPEPVVTVGGRRYKVVQGADAYLIVSYDDLTRLVKNRPRAGGLERKP
jgi:hypothetical protein